MAVQDIVKHVPVWERIPDLSALGDEELAAYMEDWAAGGCELNSTGEFLADMLREAASRLLKKV